jgi:plasmid replication initiation protein
MNTIYNHLKNAVDNHINGYSKKGLFVIKTLSNSEKPYRVVYHIGFEASMFLIDIEYTNKQIEISFASELIPTKTSLFEINDFVKYMESMSHEDLKRKFEFLSRN